MENPRLLGSRASEMMQPCSQMKDPENPVSDHASGYSRLPLMEVEHSEVAAADVIFLSKYMQPDGVNTVEADKLLRDVFEDLEVGKAAFPTLFKTCQSKKPTLRECRDSLRKDLCAWLPRCGFSVSAFKSADEDEVALRVSLDHPELEEFYAETQGVELQVAEDAIELIGIKQPDMDGTKPPYLSYSKDEQVRLKKKWNLDKLFQRFYAKNPQGSILRTVDRIRIIHRIVNRTIDTNALIKYGLLIQWYPVHYKLPLQELRAQWATPFKMFDFSFQPMYSIRNYFGEYIAFYFALLGFTTRAFLPLAILGLFVKIFIFAKPLGEESELYGQGIQAFCLVAFGALFITFWDRREYQLKAEWNMVGAAVPYMTRSEFQGEMLPNPLNMKEMTPQYPWRKQAAAKTISFLVTVLYILLVLFCVGSIYALQPTFVRLVSDHFGEEYGHFGYTLSSMVMAFQITVFNMVWDPIVDFLLYLENHKTMSEYSTALVHKLFWFQALNSYNSFIYMGFFQRRSARGCPDDDCVALLQMSLYSTFGALGCASVVGALLPKIKMEVMLYLETREIKKKYAAAGKSETEIPKLCFMERQAKMMDYGVRESVKDMLAVVLALGYVFLFSAVAPFVTVIALVSLLTKLRADAWKMCMTMRRPFPMVSLGIGVWNDILRTLSWIGLVTSVAIPILNMKVFDKYSLVEKIAIAACLEHILVVAKVMLSTAVPKEASATKLLMDRRAYVTDRLRRGADDDSKMNPELQASPIDPSKILCLDENHPEWSKLDHDYEENIQPQLVRKRSSLYH